MKYDVHVHYCQGHQLATHFSRQSKPLDPEIEQKIAEYMPDRSRVLRCPADDHMNRLLTAIRSKRLKKKHPGKMILEEADICLMIIGSWVSGWNTYLQSFTIPCVHRCALRTETVFHEWVEEHRCDPTQLRGFPTDKHIQPILELMNDDARVSISRVQLFSVVVFAFCNGWRACRMSVTATN